MGSQDLHQNTTDLGGGVVNVMYLLTLEESIYGSHSNLKLALQLRLPWWPTSSLGVVEQTVSRSLLPSWRPRLRG